MPRDVPFAFFLLILLVWVVVARAVLVFAHKLPPTCGNCGRRLERRRLGEAVCSCGR
jgi:hypothetical protein